MARKTTFWRFADATERDATVGGGSGAIFGDMCRLASDETIWVYDGTNWQLPPMPSFTVATVPSASSNPRSFIFVSDETGGAVMAFSDGTDWRRVTDRAVIS